MIYLIPLQLDVSSAELDIDLFKWWCQKNIFY